MCSSSTIGLGWLLPGVLAVLSGLAWFLHELEIRTYRQHRSSLDNQLRAAARREDELTTQLDRAMEELTRLARIDPLTGLANEQTFLEALDEEWRRAARQNMSLSLVVIDVDAFRAYNDSLGSEAGDACLQAIAKVLKSSARRAGDIAARRQGNRFALLFAHTDREIATELAKRVRAAIAALNLPHPSSRVAAIVTVSVGVASASPTMNDKPDGLIADAADALHVAKAGGRNRVETMWRRARSA